MIDGEHYIRGLSDNELERFVGLNRDMYTKAELLIADDEMSKRKRARAAKSAAPTATPRPSESPSPQAAKTPETGTFGGTKPPVPNRVSTDTYPKQPQENKGRIPEARPDRSAVRRDYNMPPPEEPAEPVTPPDTGGRFMYCTNCGNKLSLDADDCPNCGNRVSLKDDPDPYTPLQSTDFFGRRSRDSSCSGAGSDWDDCCYGYGRWRCCDTDI